MAQEKWNVVYKPYERGIIGVLAGPEIIKKFLLREE